MNNEFAELYGKASVYCSKSERCISEVNQYLSKYCQDFELINDIVSHLVTDRFIDEQRYANAFVNDKFRFSGWGKIKISYQLKQKKIHSDIIRNSLDLINDEQYSDFLNNLLQKKQKELKNKDSELIKASLLRFAISRGFEFEIVLKAINTIKL